MKNGRVAAHSGPIRSCMSLPSPPSASIVAPRTRAEEIAAPLLFYASTSASISAKSVSQNGRKMEPAAAAAAGAARARHGEASAAELRATASERGRSRCLRACVRVCAHLDGKKERRRGASRSRSRSRSPRSLAFHCFPSAALPRWLRTAATGPRRPAAAKDAESEGARTSARPSTSWLLLSLRTLERGAHLLPRPLTYVLAGEPTGKIAHFRRRSLSLANQ